MKINEISENMSHTAKRIHDIERSKKVKPGSEEWFKLWFSLPYLKESTMFSEGYKLQLERDKDMDVLHIVDTKTNKRTEVRGKPGYETDYDPNDSLHILLDKVGKSANISDLMNGEVVSINPKHPDAEKAKTATFTAFNESVSGEEMLKMFHNMHHDAGINPDMDEWVKSQEWGIDTVDPKDIVDFEELFDYDDPFDRIIDVDEGHVKTYMNAIKSGRKLDPVILGPKHSDGKYSIVDGNHRALAYAALNMPIPAYMPMGQVDEATVTEAFDNPYKFKVTENNNNRWQAQAVTDNNIIISFLATNIDTGWGIDFKTANADTPNNTTYDLTGKGDGQRTMTTVLAMLKKFIQDHSPKEIYFDAAKDAGNSRTNLYQKIVQRFAGGLGYTVDVQDAGNRDDFTLVKKVQETTVTEALDNPYPFKLTGPDESQSFVATAQTPNGPLIMEFSSTDYDNFGIDFAVGKSMGKTQAGDEFRVFATVVAMMKKWINTVGIEHVESFDFGANKDEHASDGRAKLYTRFAKQLASKLGWKLEQSTTGNGDTAFFRLVNPKPIPRDDEYWDALEENFADGKKKGKSRPGRFKKAGVSCKGSVTSLRKKAKNSSGERQKGYHWCSNMKAGKKK